MLFSVWTERELSRRYHTANGRWGHVQKAQENQSKIEERNTEREARRIETRAWFGEHLPYFRFLGAFLASLNLRRLSHFRTGIGFRSTSVLAGLRQTPKRQVFGDKFFWAITIGNSRCSETWYVLHPVLGTKIPAESYKFAAADCADATS